MSGADAMAPAAPARSLKRLALQGSAISLVAYGTMQALRIVAHALMAQALMPGAFGIMAIINTVVQGVQMFADVGIGPSIIQHARGEEPRFLRTAWTIQVVRGVVLWAVVSAIAVPVALAYGQRDPAYGALAWLLPVAGLSTIIAGCNSTSLFTLNRRLLLARLSVLDLVAQVVGLGAMLAWAMWDASVWAFVVGGLVGALTRCIASHAWLPGIVHRLAWDRTAVRDLFRFGRWVFGSTAVGFVGERGYMLLLGVWMVSDRLGLMSAATMLAAAVDDAMSRVWQTVLFPTYARLKDRGHAHLYRRVAQVRLWLMAATMPPLILLALTGEWLAGALYQGKREFMDVGPMLVVLASGKLLTARTSAYPILLAVGDSYRYMVLKIVTTGMMLAGMAIGGALDGEVGMVYGLAFGPALAYPAHAWALRHHRMNMFHLDALGYAIGGAAAAAALWMLGPGRVW